MLQIAYNGLRKFTHRLTYVGNDHHSTDYGLVNLLRLWVLLYLS